MANYRIRGFVSNAFCSADAFLYRTAHLLDFPLCHWADGRKDPTAKAQRYGANGRIRIAIIRLFDRDGYKKTHMNKVHI